MHLQYFCSHRITCRMAYLIGAFIGGFIGVLLISLLTGRLFFREYEPDSKARWSVMTAWLICSTLAGIGIGNGSFYLPAYLLYAPSAFAVFLLRRWQLRKEWLVHQSDTFA